MLELRTLGTVDLRSDGATVLSVLSQPARIAVLAYLAVAKPRGPVRRDVLLNLFWGERDEGAARAALRQTLYRLRQSLGDEVIEGTGEQSVALRPDAVWCDAVEFERALDERRGSDAAKLYNGPFLSGFHLPDALEFEHWADAERHRLAHRAAMAFSSLSEAADARGAEDEAVRFAHRVLELDPDDERAWRRLIELLDRQGDRAAALRSYEQLTERMATELKATPSPETQALIARIRGRRLEEGAPTAVAAGASERAAPAPRAEAGRPAAGAAPAPVAEAPAPARPWPRTRLAALVGAALLMAGLVIGGLMLVARRVPRGELAGPANGGEAAARMSGPSAIRTAAASSIAVLPFLNLSARPDEEYFSDGLTEELITTLSHLRSLRVVARTSAFAFKGQNRDVREIARLLGVGSVLEGSVRRDGERLRVSVQLIDASSGFHLWSATYERRMKDLFEVQTDLALRIADALRAELTPAEVARLRRSPTTSLDAYTLYLKGRYFQQQRSGGRMSTAIEYFRRAIAADSGFAAAYAGLASVYGPLAIHGFIDPDRARATMRGAALRAVWLDPDLAEGRMALGAYYGVLEWEERRGEREFVRALELDPGDPTAYGYYAYLLETQGRFDEAIAARSRAYELNPLEALAAAGRATALRLAGRLDAALADYRSALELDSTVWLTRYFLAELYETRGDLGNALRENDRAIGDAGATLRPRAARARLLALSGDTGRARVLVDTLKAEAHSSGIWLPSIALALYALGRPAEALTWLERAYRQRHPELQYLRVAPASARMRADPRFAEFFRRIQPD